MPFIYIILPTIFRNGFINYVQSYLGAIWLKKNGHSSPITQFSSPITNYSITHFLSLNNEDISHSARLAPITQLCFQPKKLKKLGPTHWPNVIRLFSLIFFFSFSPDSHLSLPLIFLCLSPSFFSASPLCFSPCYSPKPLHEPNDGNQGLDLRRRSPSSSSATYLVGIVTQRRKISSDLTQQRRSVIMETCSDLKKAWEQKNRTRGDLNS